MAMKIGRIAMFAVCIAASSQGWAADTSGKRVATIE